MRYGDKLDAPNMSKRWIYDLKHKSAFYQEGNSVYDKRGHRVFWVSRHWLYNAETSKREYYISGRWIYKQGGGATHYYSRT